MPKSMSVRERLDRAADLRRQNNLRAAETWYRQVLALRPDEAEAIVELGAMLQFQGRYAEVVEIADAALAVRGDLGMAWLARGDAHLNGADAAAAVPDYERAAQDPKTRFDATVRLAKSKAALGMTAEAGAGFDAALQLLPGSPVATYERGLFRLATRNYGAGWSDYEARWDLARFVEASRGLVSPGLIPHLARDPRPEQFLGKRVLVVGEQAVGDQVMFASLLPDLSGASREVVCVCEPRLLGLFAASFPDIRFVHPNNAQVDADLLVAMGSLGAAYRRDEAAFPGTPYLRPSEAAKARWGERLGPRQGLRIGLSWRGGVAGTRRSARSLDLAALAPLLSLPGCEFVNLQYGDVADEVARANATLSRPIRSFPAAEMHDFDDLAGLVANMDLVVSVQTTLVHLSGALGRPCLAMLPTQAEWRYTTSGDTLPWYGSVRLVRQQTTGDWPDVVDRVVQAVQAWAES